MSEKLILQFKKKPILLGFLILLLTVRFVIVPVYEWQKKLINENNSLANRVEKTERVLSAKRYNDIRYEQLTARFESKDEFLFEFEDDVKFKLERQQELDSLLPKYGVNLLSIGWQPIIEDSSAHTLNFVASTRIEGRTIEVISLINFIDNRTKIYIDSFNFDIDSHGETLGNMRGTLNLSYYVDSIDE
ncbi:hypothetical protein PA25_03650 [Pseudoalteromonas sp. A25]|uniref:hypothetical protein n=1 Tax=Pseudoalteromonas sp. A25 TaxID=116092 RepID=UPI001260E034|nr:hypothetical protein [Pseudoalteromonas sp. A25]BBN80380.1 hypothetical protein PA25_03650 [Pseudoalteromonas sp. A25]